MKQVLTGSLAVLLVHASVCYAGTTEVMSVDNAGNIGDHHSNAAAISAEGRYVAFHSKAGNLVPGDTNDKMDIFVHDRQTGKTTIISRNHAGEPGNSDSTEPGISADGRYIVFRSGAGNIVWSDASGQDNILVHDRQTGETSIINKSSKGALGNNHAYEPVISADGRLVAFQSGATNLVPRDTNDKFDIFVHDRQTGETWVISKSSSGKLANKHSHEPAISADGRYVAFRSDAGNLVPGDTNGTFDVFVHDRKTGTIRIVSRNSKGKPANGPSSLPAISADGRYVAFESEAGDLVPGDTNGKADAFVHDKRTGRTTIVSVSSDGIQGDNGGCFAPSLSADGGFVAFESDAGNLVPGDSNGVSDIFVRDRQ